MKKSIVIIISSIIALIIILSCVVVFAESDKNKMDIGEKAKQEIKYLDNVIITILGNLNEINKTSNQEESAVKWDYIQSQIENLYQTWNTVSIDLYSLNIDRNSILSFSDVLNSSTQNIKKKDIRGSLEDTAKLYQFLPKYIQGCNQDNKETNIYSIKSGVVTAYVYVTNEKWQEAESQLSETEKQFASLLNSVNQEFKNQTSANQCYILVNELIKAVRLKDKDIFFIEYQNLMEKIETI